MEDVEENVDDVQIESQGTQDIVVWLELVFPVLVVEDDDGVANEVNAGRQNTEKCGHKFGISTPEECERGGTEHEENDHEQEGSGEGVVDHDGHSIHGQSQDHREGETGSLSDDPWVHKFASCPDQEGDSEREDAQ